MAKVLVTFVLKRGSPAETAEAVAAALRESRGEAGGDEAGAVPELGG